MRAFPARGIRGRRSSVTLRHQGAPILQRYFSTFPPGLPGIGLLLLRLAVAAAMILAFVGGSEARDNGVIVAAIAFVAAAALTAGLLTPLAGTAVALLATAGAVGLGLRISTAEAVLVAVTAVAAVLLGPGAYSIDARLFGRREIVVSQPPRR